jgi:pyridoxine kinase
MISSATTAKQSKTTLESFASRVLSIQSHVVHGHVGNKSSVFPLQLAGFEVDQINTCQLSHHTGYGRMPPGVRHSGEDVMALFEGLRTAGLFSSYTHVLSGYTNQSSVLHAIATALKDMISLKSRDSELYYVCDPVLGDNGRLYVPEVLVPIYRDVLIPLSSLVTPNQFEAEILTGVKISDVASLNESLDKLHSLGAKSVVITSTDKSLSGDDQLWMFASCPLEEVSNSRKLSKTSAEVTTSTRRFGIKMPRLDFNFAGTGDLTAALFVIERSRHPQDFVSVLENVATIVYSICKRTLDYTRRCRGEAPGGFIDSASINAVIAASPSPDVIAAFGELRLIQSRNDLDRPPRDEYCNVISSVPSLEEFAWK